MSAVQQRCLRFVSSSACACVRFSVFVIALFSIPFSHFRSSSPSNSNLLPLVKPSIPPPPPEGKSRCSRPSSVIFSFFTSPPCRQWKQKSLGSFLFCSFFSHFHTTPFFYFHCFCPVVFALVTYLQATPRKLGFVQLREYPSVPPPPPLLPCTFFSCRACPLRRLLLLPLRSSFFVLLRLRAEDAGVRRNGLSLPVVAHLAMIMRFDGHAHSGIFHFFFFFTAGELRTPQCAPLCAPTRTPRFGLTAAS
jgi:hypothetical protein